MKRISIWMLAAILTISGATMLTGCSKADSPVDEVKPDVKMSDVLGEWIFEYDGGSVTPIPGNEEEGFPTDANGLAMLYFFDDNGIGWKEMNILKDQEVIYVPVCRYTSEFRYIVDPSGTIRIIFLNDDGTDGEEEDELVYEDGQLYSILDEETLTLTRATSEQSRKYREATDSWYGGSDRQRSVGGLSNDNFKWGGSFPVSEKER